MRRGEAGFTLVAVLALLAVCMLALSAAGPLWAEASKREREIELLRLGSLYAHALKSYRDASPGSMAEYPQRLEQLLQDERFVGIRRHVRKLYADPVDPRRPWGVIRDDRGGIAGVYSRSEDRPVSSAPQQWPKLKRDAQRYTDWIFMAEDSK